MEEKKQRGRYCIAGTPNQQSCQNRSFTPGIGMYQFPADPAVRAKWVQCVRRHRHDFKNPTSKYTSLCVAHFEDSCYERSLSVLSSMEAAGMKVKHCLKKDAIPTRDTTTPPGQEELSERSKRQVRQVSCFCFYTSWSLFHDLLCDRRRRYCCEKGFCFDT